jgi:hypothetical protein
MNLPSVKRQSAGLRLSYKANAFGTLDSKISLLIASWRDRHYFAIK